MSRLGDDFVHGRHAEDLPRRGTLWKFPAKEIVDRGFLELVRYGIRRPDDPVVVDSVPVLDAVLKVDTPHGPCWRRTNTTGTGRERMAGRSGIVNVTPGSYFTIRQDPSGWRQAVPYAFFSSPPIMTVCVYSRQYLPSGSR